MRQPMSSVELASDTTLTTNQAEIQRAQMILNYYNITDLKDSLNWSNFINCNIWVQALSNEKLTFS